MSQNRMGLRAFSGLCMFLTVALFALMSLFTVVVGAGVYRSVVARGEHTHEVRTAMAYVTGKLRACNSPGDIRLEKTEVGNDVLVLSESIDGDWYETRIYAHGGRLYEVFTARDMEFVAGEGQAIAVVQAFGVQHGANGLLCLSAVVDGQEYAVHVALPE